MSRITRKLDQLRSAQKKALIPFITAGDPSLEATVPVMHALVDAGADLIELGVPFSDPMADGVVIQRSSERALKKGMTLHSVLAMVKQFRQRDTTTPVVLMGYLNPVEIHGVDGFAQQAAAAGIDGILIVDLPAEEADDVRQALNAEQIDLIALAAPTTSSERLNMLSRLSQGYLYYVSFTGVTGASERMDADAAIQQLASLRHDGQSMPVMAGFGIKDAQSARKMAAGADGVIIGSALVGRLAEAESTMQAVDIASQFLKPIRDALDS